MCELYQLVEGARKKIIKWLWMKKIKGLWMKNKEDIQ
jgi:hypothetical protein